MKKGSCVTSSGYWAGTHAPDLAHVPCDAAIAVELGLHVHSHCARQPGDATITSEREAQNDQIFVYVEQGPSDPQPTTTRHARRANRNACAMATIQSGLGWNSSLLAASVKGGAICRVVSAELCQAAC